MVKKTISRRLKHRKTRETIKRGGSKIFSTLRTRAMRIINELAELSQSNHDITKNIIVKVKDLRNLYTEDSSKSPEEDQVLETSITHYEPLEWLPDIGSMTTNPVPDKNTVSRNEESTYTAKRGTWDFYILQALDKDPKTENEITELIRNQNPHKFKGKTSDNTINARLQKLVREGNAQRSEYAKGKRTAYRYFIE